MDGGAQDKDAMMRAWKSYMGSHRRPDALLAAMALTASLAMTGLAGAQQQPPPGSPAWQSQQPPRPTQAPAKQKQQSKSADSQPAASGSEASLRQRVEQLEEQLVDLQVVVGTVESLARGGTSTASTAYRGGAPISSGSSGADAGRIAALETQVQALTSQLEQMATQIRQLQGSSPRGPSGPAPRAGSFGTTTVTPNDPIANIINTPETAAGAPRGAPQAASSPIGRQQYEQAYSLLLQQNYPAAEAGFSDFLQKFPSDELTPNAQFWLGETHFVRGQWDSAAASFLKVAQSFPRSDKAPDSLAKFAMSMERKGNKQAACRALQELNARYPNPPAHVRTWETAERRRAGCS